LTPFSQDFSGIQGNGIDANNSLQHWDSGSKPEECWYML
jgi:hypothetical protein